MASLVLTVSGTLIIAIVCWFVFWFLRRRRLVVEITSLRSEASNALEAFRQEQRGYDEVLASLKETTSRAAWAPFQRIVDDSPREVKIYEKRLAQLQNRLMPFGLSAREEFLRSWQVLLDNIESGRRFPQLVAAKLQTVGLAKVVG
ncbi:MAG: hypothetical protein M1275_02460 [Patescibacteria group bacterium]|nr:hypothetical protein [Patescibacteria group bacterium]